LHYTPTKSSRIASWWAAPIRHSRWTALRGEIHAIFLTNGSFTVIRGLLDDPFHLAAVDAELAGDGSLAGTGVVPSSYRLLQRRRFCQRGWSTLLRVRRDLVPHRVRRAFDGGLVLGSYEGRKQLERTDQRQSGPGADQRTYRPVPEAVCQVGPNGGDNASPQTPPRLSTAKLRSPLVAR
jgi:hypothetical protein